MGAVRILLHDEHCLVLHKPANMLSVPGRKMLDSMQEQNNQIGAHSRVLQWTAVIQAVKQDLQNKRLSFPPHSTATTATHDQDQEREDRAVLQIMQSLRFLENIPRKEKLVHKYLQRTMKVTDETLQSRIWQLLQAKDSEMWHPKIENIPPDLVSAYDVARLASGGGSIFAVHRLDMETSGVLLFAKTARASAHLAKQFAERKTKKRYLAEVAGQVAPSLQRISHKLRADPTNRPWQVVDASNGKECETLLTVLEHRPRRDSTLVQLNPVTGRTHQLRVHMAHEGHAAIGDSLYAPAEVYAQSHYLHLHAQSLQFMHPHSEKVITVTSDECPFL